jgi:hypothetical protein
MKSRHAAPWLAAIAVTAACALAAAPPAGAQDAAPKPQPEKLPEKLSGEAIKAAWFDGKPFTATSPEGTAFLLTFTADGKSVRRPVEKKKGLTGATGFWRIIAEGYCSRWTGQNREKCFNVRPDPENAGAVVVRFGPQLVAVWKR